MTRSVGINLIRIKNIAVLFSLVIFPLREAHVSQIHYQTVQSSLPELVEEISSEDQVVVVQGPLSTKTYRQVVFPAKTHFGPKDNRTEDTYTEFASEYVVVDVIKSDILKTGDRFWAWKEPAYSLKDTKRYHEEGLSKSPVVLKREPVFPLTGDRHIAVAVKLDSKSTREFPLVFSIQAEEGLGADPAIRKLLKSKSSVKHW